MIWLVRAPFADAATFSVTSTNDSGAGSLRQAILDANLSPDTDAIVFNISGAGPHAIRPASALPTLTYPVTLNGYTQSGAVSNSLAVGDNAALKIRLSGISAGAGVNGLQVNVAGCEIRGLSIVNWSGNGIYLLGQSDTRVQGNFIGLDVDGVTVATNSGKGVRSTAVNALIGGLDPGQRNIISGNGTGGIELFNSAGNTIQGNYIGTDASGTLGLGNGGSGIYVANPNSTNNVIGGTNTAARNIISASTGSGTSGNNGCLLNNCLNNFILGNFIGTDVTGTNALGNAGAGILMTNALHTVVGGLSPGAGNVIAFNGAAGLRIPAGTNEVSGNAIFSNGLLGIDLGTVNVTANDAGDADTGANNLQNFPVLTSATNLAGTITIRGTLNSLPIKSFRMEFFSSASCDGSGSGEGKNYLGTTNVTTDAGNNATFTVAFPAVDAADTVVTATATAPDGGTSEFSACRAIVSSDPAAILSQPVFQSVFLGSNATFSVVASGALPLTYQWLLNGSPITQATNSTLVVTNVLPQQAGGYGVQVSNSFGFALSQTATLSLQTPPTDLVVGNLNDSGAGSLRYALLNANLDPDLSRINFNLSGPGPFSIVLSSPLPTITTPVTIDATTQPGFTNKPIVELDGSGVTGDGLVLTGGASTLRGLVINRFPGSGVRLESGGGNLIAGNFIGTALDGRTDRGNGQHGIVITNSAGNIIGGTNTLSRNALSQNTSDGLRITGSGASNNVALGNSIGTDWTGLIGAGNKGNGLTITNASRNTIGGSTPGSGNLISDQSRDGVYIGGASSANNVISGNLIGTDLTGTNLMGNVKAGVHVDGGTNHVVGGISGGAGNLAAFNGQAGVLVTAGHCSILGNVLHSNGGLSIDLNDNGVTANDLADPDSGPNNLQNFPVLSAVTNNGFSTRINGTLNSAGSRSFWVEFFASPVCGEAKTVVGAGPVTTDPLGNGSFSFLFTTGNLTNQSVVATATDPFQNSSELSACRAVVFSPKPVIQASPEDQLIPVRGDATFTVVATGPPALTYQWIFNGNDIPGATASTLFLQNIPTGWAGSYGVRVSNGGGSVVSDAASLLVLPEEAPSISLQPQSQTLPLAGATTLRVGYAGSGPFSFQWRLNGVNIPGATNSTLNLSNVQAGAGGSYSVVVFTPAQVLESAVATLLVDVPSSQLADDFSDRAVIHTTSGSQRGSNVGASRELSEPEHGTRGAKSVWIAWQAPADGVATFSTAGSDFDTLLAVYTGNSLDRLNAVDRDDDRQGFATSQVRFNTIGGTLYQIAVDGYNGASGNVVLSWALQASLALLPEIHTPPPRQRVASTGNSFLLSLGYSSQDIVDVQWLINGQEIPNATYSVLSIDNLQANQVGGYSVRLRTAQREVITLPADVQINSDGDTNAAAHDKFAELVRPAPLPPPPAAAVSFASAGPSRGFTSSQVFSTFGATKEIGEPNHCGIPGGASEWYVYQAQSSDTLHIDTAGSDFATVLAVYTGPGTDFASLIPVACHSGLDGHDSSVEFTATQGTIYYIAVDGVGGVSGTVVLNFNLGPAPQITAQPAGVISELGASVSLSVTASGMDPLAYQWSRDGVNVAGATNSTLTFNSVQAAHAGHYTVVVSNPVAQLTSAEAILIAPPLNQVQYQILSVNGQRQLRLFGPAGLGTFLQASTNLVSWTSIYTNQSTSGTLDFTETQVPAFVQRYYRFSAEP